MASNLFNAGGKLFFGVGLLILGFGLIGAVFGVTIGGIIWLLVCIFFVLKRTSGEKKKVLFSMKNDLVLITATLLLLNLLNNIDMILARSLLPANEAGIYGAASQIGKIIFFLTSGLSIIVIPKTSEKIALRENSTKVIRQTTAIIIGISVIPLLLVWAFPNLMVTLMYGKDFFAASNVILISCLAMTIFSATYSVAHYFIARNKKSILPILLIFNALEVALILVNQSSALAIALDVLVSVGLLLLVLFVQSIISLKKKNKN
jgi:O-antigen/teichoic acid export membrane protein